MTDYIIHEQTLTDIGDAIRQQLDESDLYDPLDMPEKILSISGGMPDKLLISDFDFTNQYSWGNDKVRNFTIGSTSYSQIAITNEIGMSPSGRNAAVYPSILFNAGMYYEVEINTGENENLDLQQWNQLFKLNRTDSHFTLTYGRDIAYDGGTGRWRVSDQSGANKFLNGGNGNPHYLDNKKINICYGFKYENGQRVANENKISWYVDDVLELEGTESLISSSNNTAQLVLFSGNAMMGFVFENMKVYQHFNVPQPVSLMSMPLQKSDDIESTDDEKSVEETNDLNA